jgi:phosphoribosylformylglycinamidine synthase
MDAKEPGNPVYLVGPTRDELGGSHYYRLYGHRGARVPRVDVALGKKIFRAVHRAIREGLLRACHDLSEGGLAVAAAEMAFAGNLGLRIDLAGVDGVSRDDQALFSETPSRFLVEVRPADAGRLAALLDGVPAVRLGEVTPERRLVVVGRRGRPVIDEPVAALKEAWQAPLKW